MPSQSTEPCTVELDPQAQGQAPAEARTDSIEPPSDLEETLRDRFALPAFREGQREVIEAVLRGEDALVVRPTGSGKSLCYQLPALRVPGVTVVVSPLIALMKDQLDALAERGLPATAIHSGLAPHENAEALQQLRTGRARIVYVAPERFRIPSFLEALSRVNVSLLAIDEAHCVSEWGHEFRPDYRRIGAAREALGRPTAIALTATATARVRRDILDELGIPEANVFVSGFDRPNLIFEVVKAGRRAEKMEHLHALVRGLQGREGAGLIYCATRKRAEEIGLELGVPIYHAGLEAAARTRIQEEFMGGAARVLVATNAFGMGIDRPDIRFVAHAEMPRSIEAYYQEAGRAGRDGAAARCVLYYGYADRMVHDFFIDEATPEREFVEEVWRALEPERGPGPRAGAHPAAIASRIAQGAKPRGLAADAALKLLEKAGHIAGGRSGRQVDVLDPVAPEALRIDWTAVLARRSYEKERLEKVIAYASRDGCRTREILRYFGDRSPAAFGGACGHCDRCGVRLADSAPLALAALPSGADAPVTVARKVLSCVARVGHGATRTSVSQCLAGSKAAMVRESGHDKLSTYGILRGIGRDGVIAWIDALGKARLLSSFGGRLTLTREGIEVMAGRAPLPQKLAEGARPT